MSPASTSARYQGNVNWASHGARAKFAYVKATEGTNYTNPYFSQQYTGSYNAGLIRGAYHFAPPNTSAGAAQADYFVDHGGGWSKDGKTLPGMLDIEWSPYSALLRPVRPPMVTWIHAFSDEYHAQDHPLAGHLHGDELVEPSAPATRATSLDEPAVGRAVRVVGGDAAVQLGLLHVLAVQLLPDRSGPVQRGHLAPEGARDGLIPTSAGYAGGAVDRKTRPRHPRRGGKPVRLTALLPLLAAVPLFALPAPAAAAAGCFDPATPLTVEEQRLTASLPAGGPAVGPELVRLAGLDPLVAEVKHDLCAARTPRRAERVVTQAGDRLWRTAVDRAQGRRPDLGTLDRFDDRPLYWARLQLSSAIRQWTPASASQRLRC